MARKKKVSTEKRPEDRPALYKDIDLYNLGHLNIEQQGLDFAQKGIDIYKSHADARIDYARMSSPEYSAKFVKAGVQEVGAGFEIETFADVTGLFFDVGTYLSGVPECWTNEVQQVRKCITLKVMYGVYWEYSPTQVADYANMIIELYNSFIRLYNVRIEFEYGIKCESTDTFYKAVVTDFNEWLQPETLHYVCSPLFYRLYMMQIFKNDGAKSGIPMAPKHTNKFLDGIKYDGGDTLEILPRFEMFFRKSEYTTEDYITAFHRVN